MHAVDFLKPQPRILNNTINSINLINLTNSINYIYPQPVTRLYSPR